MKSKSRNSGNAALFFLLFVVFLTIGGLYFYKNRSSTQIPNQLTSCKDFDAVTNIVKSSLTGDYKITTRDYYHESALLFSWRRNQTEPLISYPGQKNRTIYLYGQPADSIAKQFETKIITQLESSLGKKDALNYDRYPGMLSPNIEAGTYSFKKDSDYYVVRLDGNLVNDVILNSDGTINQEIEMPQNSSVVTIKCGVANAQHDDIYNKILLNEKYNQNATLAIWDIKDRLVYLSVGMLGGYGQFWIVDGDKVEKLGEGQDTPPCDLFEPKKVGRGMECYDVQKASNRIVDY